MTVRRLSLRTAHCRESGNLVELVRAQQLGPRFRGDERRRLPHDHPQRAVERAEHSVELLIAPENVSGRRNDAVGALAARQPRIFLDAVDRDFTGAAEYRENRAVFEKVDGVIAPLAGRDLAAVKPQEPIELAAAESYFTGGDVRTMLVPAPRAWINFAEVHDGASC